MARFLKLDEWNRRSHFDLFRGYDRPFFNVCARVDVGPLRQLVESPGDVSFFLACLYLSSRAAHEVEAFKYRLRGSRVLVHEVVDVGTTVLLDDGTFGFAYLAFEKDFGSFQKSGRASIEKCRQERKLDPSDDRDDVIHYTVLPWIAFTSIAHARRSDPQDSTPKIVFGKFQSTADGLTMPVSVEVHHALMDGIHVGEYFTRLQDYLSHPADALGESRSE